jgi:hypothetical protein
MIHAHLPSPAALDGMENQRMTLAFLTLAAAYNPPNPWSQNTQNMFLRTIKKWGDSFWLAHTSEKVAAQLDNPALASHFVNQRVKVIGTIDLSRNRIAVEAIVPT